MTPTESRLSAPDNGRSPADLTKKELVAHLTADSEIPQWKLNAMTRDDIVALFDFPEAEALAAIDAAGLAHGRKHRKPKQAEDKTAVSPISA
jgi:hypothetical protein